MKTTNNTEVSTISTDIVVATKDIVLAHLRDNQVAAEDLPDLICRIATSLRGSAEPQAPAPALNATRKKATPKKRAAAKKAEPLVPALPINKSVTSEFIYCLEDGKPFKMMKRYLRAEYNMTPEQYRAKWGLPEDYPMTAPGYSAQKSSYAKHVGLGTDRNGRPSARRHQDAVA